VHGFRQRCAGRSRRLRVLTILDTCTRECLCLQAGQSLRGRDVAAALNRIGVQRGLPETITCDNGSEFTGRAMISGLTETASNSTSPDRKANRQCSHRGVQRSPSTRVSLATLVLTHKKTSSRPWPPGSRTTTTTDPTVPSTTSRPANIVGAAPSNPTEDGSEPRATDGPETGSGTCPKKLANGP
jgi:transposase InsO family protein